MTKEAAAAATQRYENVHSGPWKWEPHGDGWALYSRRDSQHHGLNLITVPDHGFDATGQAMRDFIEHSVTDLPSSLDMLERVMKFVSTAHELGCFVDDADPDATKLWDRADALIREWKGKAVTR